MKLYYAPGACSLSPHIALCEAGLEFTLDKFIYQTKMTESGENFMEVNPKGYVPALRLDDGSVLTEGVAIVQYIADQTPEKNLIPACGTMERYRVQEWLTYISSELHKTFSVFYGNPTDDVKQKTMEKLAKRMDYVDAILAKQPYLMGNDFSVADGYLFTIVRWSDRFQVPVPANLAAYMLRIAARPTVAAALAAEGLTYPATPAA